MRKIIQITATLDNRLVALCDDGTVWQYNSNAVLYASKWVCLPAIPQEKDEAKAA